MEVNWKEFDSHFNHIHDWRTYIQDMRYEFAKLPEESKKFVKKLCEKIAEAEEWE